MDSALWNGSDVFVSSFARLFDWAGEERMSKDDVIRMAREAGLPSSELYHGNLERFAALVAAHVRETEFKPDWNKYQQGLADGAAAEREACAKVCEEDGLLWGQRYAAAIRARGQA